MIGETSELQFKVCCVFSGGRDPFGPDVHINVPGVILYWSLMHFEHVNLWSSAHQPRHQTLWQEVKVLIFSFFFFFWQVMWLRPLSWTLQVWFLFLLLWNLFQSLKMGVSAAHYFNHLHYWSTGLLISLPVFIVSVISSGVTAGPAGSPSDSSSGKNSPTGSDGWHSVGGAKRHLLAGYRNYSNSVLVKILCGGFKTLCFLFLCSGNKQTWTHNTVP